MVSFGELNFVTDKCFSSSLFMRVSMGKFLALSSLPSSPRQLVRNTSVALLLWVKNLRFKVDFRNCKVLLCLSQAVELLF